MNPHRENEIDFSALLSQLESGQVWEYESGARDHCRDVVEETFRALQRPTDFPPLEAAIVSGDRVALAVDPNIPQIDDVIRGVVKSIGQTDAREIDVVLWDEASDATVIALRDVTGDAIRVAPHDSAHRESLRYLGADESADPIYLNRMLVDADFVLPVVATRPLDTVCDHDLTGVFPAFADSISRQRYRRKVNSSAGGRPESNPSEPSWLLGVQLMLSVTASGGGRVAQVIAGTPESIRKELKPSGRLPDDFPPSAELVVASLDGDNQQQSWSNASRALAAASRFVRPGGTIVLWSGIDDPPTGQLLKVTEELESLEPDVIEQDDASETEFPPWDSTVGPAQTLARIAAEHRLLIHSHLDDEIVEATGLAPIGSLAELVRLSRSFQSCGVLRAAQFAGTTIDIPHSIA